MKKIIILLSIALLVTGCGRIEKNHVGVRTTFTGDVLIEEMTQGFYTNWTSTVEEYSTKEITVALNDMTPKAGDNLSMRDLDLEVYYKTNPKMVSETKIKYTGRDGFKNDLGMPAYFLVESYSRNATYKEIAKHDSLDIHKNRDLIAAEVLTMTQKNLDASDPNVFTITKVIVRNAVTDPSIEQAIKDNVAMDKKLEAKEKEIQLANKQVAINLALNRSLTPAVLQQRKLDVQQLAIESGNVSITMVMGNAVPIIPIK